MAFAHVWPGPRSLHVSYGEYDGMKPISAIVASRQLEEETQVKTQAIYFTKPPSVQGRYPQERHLIRCNVIPDVISEVFLARPCVFCVVIVVLLFTCKIYCRHVA